MEGSENVHHYRQFYFFNAISYGVLQREQTLGTVKAEIMHAIGFNTKKISVNKLERQCILCSTNQSLNFQLFNRVFQDVLVLGMQSTGGGGEQWWRWKAVVVWWRWRAVVKMESSGGLVEVESSNEGEEQWWRWRVVVVVESSGVGEEQW